MSDPTARVPAPGTAPHEVPHAASAGPQQHPPASAGPRAPLRILGIQPVLFVGIVLLVLVTLLTIVLIFVGDIETQAPRVVWTVIALVGFTALLALDLGLARRSVLPLVIGVSANVYLLAVLMLATWVEEPPALDDVYGPPLGVSLIGVYLLAFVVVRAAAAGAWALIALGRRGVLAIARVTGVAAASLLGLAAVLLTLHLAITRFGIEIGDLYWRFAVAVVVMAALAACVTTLLYWSRRQLDGPPPPAVPVAPPFATPAHPVQQQGWAPYPGMQPQQEQPGAWQQERPWQGQPMPPSSDPRVGDRGVVPNPAQQQWGQQPQA